MNRKLTAIYVSATVALSPLISWAAGPDITSKLETAGKNAGYATAAKDNGLVYLVGTIISAALGLLGIIFLALTVYGGFLWMTAAGDESKVEKAKDTITRAIIGLVIVLCAYAITYFVTTSIVDSTLAK